MKFIDLCAGIGGFRLGLESLGHTCVFSCEKDKFAQKTYEMWFGDNPSCDLTTLDPSDIPEFDMLTSGFPCQSYSIAGKRLGFKDPRGGIFFRLCNILKERNPRAAVLENVKGLISHDNGKTLGIILKTLDSLNYHVFLNTLSSSYWVPQNRERLFMACLNKKYYPNIKLLNYPALPNTRPILKSILEKKVNSKYTLADGTWSYLQKHKTKHAKIGTGFGYTLANLNSASRTLTARYHKDGSEILIPQKTKNPRKLTPRECARLMGFPDNLPIVVSDTQAYRQFGNAVVPQCVSYIGSILNKL